VEGSDEFQAAMAKFDSAMQQEVRRVLAEWAEAVKAEAEKLVPLRTGYLQRTIFAKVKDWVVEVGAEATYAAAVEFGTRNMRARPYLSPALEQYLPALEKVILDAIWAAKAEAQL
jgi:HK97 gp10 family phage protein